MQSSLQFCLLRLSESVLITPSTHLLSFALSASHKSVTFLLCKLGGSKGGDKVIVMHKGKWCWWIEPVGTGSLFPSLVIIYMTSNVWEHLTLNTAKKHHRPPAIFTHCEGIFTARDASHWHIACCFLAFCGFESKISHTKDTSSYAAAHSQSSANYEMESGLVMWIARSVKLAVTISVL